MFVKITFRDLSAVNVATCGFVGRFELRILAESWISEFSALVLPEQVKPEFEIVVARDIGFQFLAETRKEKVAEDMVRLFEKFASRSN